MSPQRIQRKRTKGWRMPNAVYVGRPGRWGNPFIADLLNGGNMSPEETVDHFRDYRAEDRRKRESAEMRRRGAGKDLACWCPLDAPCHADVLLDLANEDGAP